MVFLDRVEEGLDRHKNLLQEGRLSEQILFERYGYPSNFDGVLLGCAQGLSNPERMTEQEAIELLQCAYGAVLPPDGVREVNQRIARLVYRCQPRSNMCFDSYAERDSAITQCDFNYMPPRGTESCKRQMRFASNNQYQYDPCVIRDFPVCGETAEEVRERLTTPPPTIYSEPDTPVPVMVAPPPTIYEEQAETPAPVVPMVEPGFEPFEEELPPPEEDKTNRTVMVFGILAVVAVGGGAVYLMTRKKRKR